MSLFEDAKRAAFTARDESGGGPEYEVQTRAAIAELEDESGERLNAADVRLVLDAPFGGQPVNAGVREADPEAYEAALAVQAEKDELEAELEAQALKDASEGGQ